MAVRGTITYMRGGKIPDDVIHEDVVDLAALMKLADFIGPNVPTETRQITIVIWEVLDGKAAQS